MEPAIIMVPSGSMSSVAPGSGSGTSAVRQYAPPPSVLVLVSPMKATTPESVPEPGRGYVQTKVGARRRCETNPFYRISSMKKAFRCTDPVVRQSRIR